MLDIYTLVNMYRKLLVFIFISTSYFLNAQQLQTETVVQLEVNLIETSGLLFLNDKVITHNDSGSDSKLYEIDTLTGNISRTVVVDNVTNIDWEDICMDADYIYIGDFGNNAGSRTDLKIYKISISDYNNTLNDTVTAETINFNFGNQTSFTSALFTTNFDVEALLSFGDSLYVFTKNWGNSETSYYAISKLQGSYAVNPKGTINSQGMITGGVYNNLSNEILLCGYTFFQPFVIRISQFLQDDFENGNIDRFLINVGTSSIQIEGICNYSNEGYYLSSESHLSGDSELLKITKANDLGLNYNQTEGVILFPNPVSDILFINSSKNLEVELYNSLNELIMVTTSKQLNISNLIRGLYVVRVFEEHGENTIHKIIVQ